MGDEPRRVRPGPALSSKMAHLARRHTAPEMAVRRALHAAGARYRVQFPLPGNRRRTIDIAFPRARVAVFIDGCFWHGCPAHGVQPRTNEEWWSWKIARNRDRDADSTRTLESQGWRVLRVWEHEDPEVVRDAVMREVRERIRPAARRGERQEN